jgi:transposase InsO family protein
VGELTNSKPLLNDSKHTPLSITMPMPMPATPDLNFRPDCWIPCYRRPIFHTMIFCFVLLQHWLTAFWRLIGMALPRRAEKNSVHRRARGHVPIKNCLPAKPRRAGGKPKPPYVLEAVLALHAVSGASHRTISAEFNRLHAARGMTVCPSTVRTWLRRHTTEMVAVRKATRNRVPRHVRPNHCWGVDATGKRDADGTEHFILGIIDHGTRMGIELTRTTDQTAQALLRRILLAAERFGKPRRIRTDNAPVFRSALFQAALAAAGIGHVFSAPGKPWQNGRVERLFLTLKQKLNLVAPRDGAELDRLLIEFSFWYNQIRPHQHLNGHTPAEAWFGIDPYRRVPRRVSRHVGWDGLLTGWDLRPA